MEEIEQDQEHLRQVFNGEREWQQMRMSRQAQQGGHASVQQTHEEGLHALWSWISQATHLGCRDGEVVGEAAGPGAKGKSCAGAGHAAQCDAAGLCARCMLSEPAAMCSFPGCSGHALIALPLAAAQYAYQTVSLGHLKV